MSTERTVDEREHEVGTMSENTFGGRLHGLRKAKGYTQTRLSGLLGVDIKTERNWEKNKSKPGYDTIDRLCDILECDPDYLFVKPTLDDVLEVGKIYRYIGNGEFEIVDIVALVKKALERSLNEN